MSLHMANKIKIANLTALRKCISWLNGTLDEDNVAYCFHILVSKFCWIPTINLVSMLSRYSESVVKISSLSLRRPSLLIVCY